MPVQDIGTGASIVFGTSSWSASLLAINHNDVSRPVIDTTHLGTADARTKMAGDLYDPGSLEIEVAFDADDVNTNKPPIYSTTATTRTETVTLTFPRPVANAATLAAASFSSSGFMTAFSYGLPLEDKMTASVTVEFTGVSTWTDAL